MKRAAVYLRVSTKEQTTENQRIELERVAAAKGWRITVTYEDHGISGAAPRSDRPAYNKLLADAVRSEFDVVMAWDISRLGRSLPDLVHALEELRQSAVDVYLHQQAIDTATPSGLALLQMSAVFAQFERSMLSERVKAGLARAKSKGVKLGRPALSPTLTQKQKAFVLEASIREISRTLNISVGSAHAIKKEVLQQNRF